MPTLIKRLPQSTIVGLICVILAALLAASFALFVLPHFAPRSALAAASCDQSPDAAHCDNQNPMTQGCNKDAQTIAFHNILDYSQTFIGRAERRYSPRCHTYWGRLQGSLSSKHGLGISILLKDNARSASTATGNEVFTAMVFVSSPQDQMAAIDAVVSLDQRNPLETNVPGLGVTLPVTSIA